MINKTPSTHTQKPQIKQKVKISIRNMGSHGEGVGSLDGYTIFIEGALPGEEVEAKMSLCQKKYGKAQLLTVLKPSNERVEPPCPVFDQCGGCQVMHLSYEAQLAVKHQKVVDALQRIGKISDVTVNPCLPSPTELNYRNKIQLQYRKNQLGFYKRNSHDLVEVDSCAIHCPLGDEIFRNISPLIKNAGIDFRHVIIKSALSTNEALVILVNDSLATPQLIKLSQEIRASNQAIVGVIHNINETSGNVVLGDVFNTLDGDSYIHEKIAGLTFKVSPASFFQVNPLQAEKLYQKALELADFKGHETLLDAYCGVGTLSLYFASHVKSVIGVECVEDAVEDAKMNAALNNIQNVEFTAAQSEDFIKRVESIDAILLNPPRKGCEVSFLDEIGRLLPKKVVYISCDPATLARDLSHLKTFGYTVEVVQPFDMFPQTAHVETLVKLSLL